MKNSRTIELAIFSVLIVVTAFFMLYKKRVVINVNDRTIAVLIYFLGLAISRTSAHVPGGVIVQISDEYVMDPGKGSTCWLNVDVQEKNGRSALPLSLQKKLRAHSSYNRNMLLKIATFLSSGLGLQLKDLRSSQYRD
jgi:hypothetical protein